MPEKEGCPTCGAKLRIHLAVTRKVSPKPGDLTVCYRCGDWLVFGLEMQLEHITQQILDTVDPEMLSMMAEYSAVVQDKWG